MSLTPYYSDNRATLYHGDCREILPQLPKVDLCLTDPPYGMEWKFSGQGSGRNATGGKHSQFKAQEIEGDRQDFNPAFLMGFEKLVLWGFHHFPQHLFRGSVLVWLKKYPDSFGTFLSDADLAWMRGGCGVYVSPIINPASFQNERQHPTQKPTDLMAWCIEKNSPAETILDPFAGSGTTLVAAKRLGRKSIGIEIEEKYCEIAARRLEAETTLFDLADSKKPQDSQASLFEK